MTFLEAALLEAFSTTAGTKVVATEFLFQQFVTMDDANTALDVRFGRESSPALTHRFEKSDRCRSHAYTRCTSRLQKDQNVSETLSVSPPGIGPSTAQDDGENNK